MQVNLRENEIAKAVELYMKHHGIRTRGLDITIQFSMGKGANGLKAEVNIEGLDNPVEIPGFTAHDREVDIPLQLLETMVTEPDPIPGTLGAAIKYHTETVQAHVARDLLAEDLALMAIGNDEGVMESIPEEVEVVVAVEATEPPWEGEPVAIVTLEPEITDLADDVGLEVPVEVEAADLPAEVAEEPVVETPPEPVPVAEEAKPVRRPIFAKKTPAVASEDSLIPTEEVAPELVAAKVETGPVRRTSMLFKKPIV